MDHAPLKSLADYSRFVVELLDRPTVDRSTVSVWSTSPYTGIAEGEIFFSPGLRLRIREELDFQHLRDMAKEARKNNLNSVVLRS